MSRIKLSRFRLTYHLIESLSQILRINRTYLRKFNHSILVVLGKSASASNPKYSSNPQLSSISQIQLQIESAKSFHPSDKAH